MSTTTTTTLYERIGGEAAVGAAVGLFYTKVLADPKLAPYFEGVDMERQKAKQEAFLTMAFGGPNKYSERGMRAAHASAVENGLDDVHFDAVLGHLGDTLTELGVPSELIGEAAAIAESTRADVLGR